MAGDQILINGNQLSWGSIVLKVDGDRYYGFNSLSYGDKRERVKAYGMGPAHKARGRTRGKYTTDPVKLGGAKSSFQLLRAGLAAKSANGKSYGDVEFEIVAQYVETDETPITVEINGCLWTANVTSEEESPDPLKEEIEIDCMTILRNGLTLFDSVVGAV